MVWFMLPAPETKGMIPMSITSFPDWVTHSSEANPSIFVQDLSLAIFQAMLLRADPKVNFVIP